MSMWGMWCDILTMPHCIAHALTMASQLMLKYSKWKSPRERQRLLLMTCCDAHHVGDVGVFHYMFQYRTMVWRVKIELSTTNGGISLVNHESPGYIQYEAILAVEQPWVTQDKTKFTPPCNHKPYHSSWLKDSLYSNCSDPRILCLHWSKLL